jgi:hypothetical protein
MPFFGCTLGAPFLGVCCGRASWVRFGVLLSGSPQHNKARRQKQRALAINNSRALQALLGPSQRPTADQPQTHQQRTRIHAFAFVLCGIESQNFSRPLSPYEEKREVSICALCPNLHYRLLFARVHVVFDKGQTVCSQPLLECVIFTQEIMCHSVNLPLRFSHQQPCKNFCCSKLAVVEEHQQKELNTEKQMWYSRTI